MRHDGFWFVLRTAILNGDLTKTEARELYTELMARTLIHPMRLDSVPELDNEIDKIFHPDNDPSEK